MSLLGRVTKMMDGFSEASMKAAKFLGKATNKILKRTPKVVDMGAGAANTVLEKGSEAVENVASGKAGNKFVKFLGKTTRGILSNDNSYKQIGKTKFVRSNRPLILDDLQRRGKQIANNAAGLFNLATSDTLEIGGKEMTNIFKIIEKTDDNLLGYKLNKRGVILGTSAALIAGTPAAGKKFVDDRKGYNPDGKIRKLTPQIPDYSKMGLQSG